MIRSVILASAAVAALASSAVAAEQAAAPSASPTATTGTPAGNVFSEDQARQHLVRAGFVNVSPLEKDANGRWAGTAMKDGKMQAVAVDVKGHAVQN